MLTPPSLQLCWFLIIPKEYKPTPLMLPQLSQLFHQHKKAFVSLSHFFYFIYFFYYKRHQQHFIVCNVATSLLPFKIPAALWKKKNKNLHMQLLFRTPSKTCCHLFVLKSGVYNVLWYISLTLEYLMKEIMLWKCNVISWLTRVMNKIIRTVNPRFIHFIQ